MKKKLILMKQALRVWRHLKADDVNDFYQDEMGFFCLKPYKEKQIKNQKLVMGQPILLKRDENAYFQVT